MSNGSVLPIAGDINSFIVGDEDYGFNLCRVDFLEGLKELPDKKKKALAKCIAAFALTAYLEYKEVDDATVEG